jgi:hypothetical protein
VPRNCGYGSGDGGGEAGVEVCLDGWCVALGGFEGAEIEIEHDDESSNGSRIV